jgi:O-antigen/teichoic acid export membrane protein
MLSRQGADAGPTRHSLFDDGMWVGLGQVGTLAARLVGLRMLTEVFATDVFGSASVMLALMALVLATACNPLVQALMRAVPAVDVADTSRIRRVGLGMLWPCLAMQGLLLLGLLELSSELDLHHSTYALLGLLAFTWAETMRSFETGLLTARRDQRRYAAWNFVDAWARPVGALGLAALLGPSVATMLWGYALASVLVLFLFRGWRVGLESAPAGAGDANATSEGEGDRQQRASLLRYAATLVPLAPIAWLLAGADRVFLASYAGAAATGVFVAACGLGSAPMIALSMALLTVFRPLLYRSISAGDAAGERQLLLRWIGCYVLIAAIGLLLITWLAPLAATWFLGAQFRGAADLVPWVAAAFALQGLQVVFETRIMAWHCNYRLWILQLLGGACALALYVLLIPELGAFGAVLAMLISMGCACALAVFLASRPPALAVRAT